MDEHFEPELLRGSLDLMILSILAQEPTYGYQLQQRLKTVSQNRVRLQAGTMYPILHRLEAERLIKSKWDESTGRRRKWYDLTAAGRKQLASQARQWDHYVACIQELLAPIRPELASG